MHTFLRTIPGKYTKKNNPVRSPILFPSLLSLSRNFFASSGLIFFTSLDMSLESR